MYIGGFKMEIRDRINMPQRQATVKSGKKCMADEIPKDMFSPAEDSSSKWEDCHKVFGTVGTAAGAVAGRGIIPASSALLLATLAATAVAGPLGIVVGGLAGLGLGAAYEYKSKLGRFAGGILGGAIGVGLGKLAALVPGYRPSKAMVDETKGFSFKSLFTKLFNPHYTSHKKISSKEAQKVIKDLKPGDLIITNNDEDYKFELGQKLMGKTGAWTHIGMVSENNTVVEVLISTDGPTESSPESLFTKNHHVVVVRPDYKSPESVKKTLEAARKYFGKAKYDFDFKLSSEDKLYCQEYIYKAMQDGAPEVKVEPSRFMGLEYLSADDFLKSPDMKEVYNTGSNFWMNLISKFD